MHLLHSFTASLSQGGFDKCSVFITGPGTAAHTHMNRAAKSLVICAPVWRSLVCVSTAPLSTAFRKEAK